MKKECHEFSNSYPNGKELVVETIIRKKGMGGRAGGEGGGEGGGRGGGGGGGGGGGEEQTYVSRKALILGSLEKITFLKHRSGWGKLRVAYIIFLRALHRLGCVCLYPRANDGV